MILPEMIENFVSQETCNYFNDALGKFAPVDPAGYSSIFVDPTSVEPTENHFFNKLDTSVSEQVILKDMVNLLQQSAMSTFNIKKSDMHIDRVNYRTFQDGQFFHYHIDQCGEGGEIYTALLYLNDDYEGGEIVFYDIEEGREGPFEAFHPKTGTLICFKGDHTSPHEVLPVLGGVRANIAMNFRLHEDAAK
jgi:predicted 2-oxoglutarate/Fe(II)-dependent dioxygenase YbiX